MSKVILRISDFSPVDTDNFTARDSWTWRGRDETRVIPYTLELDTAAQPLQHTATYCNTLQHTATHRSALQHTATQFDNAAQPLQHTAAHCSTLQHTAAQ